MTKLSKTILIGIVLLAGFLRFYKLSQLPPGFHADEASQGFNAYSILQTGKDIYGKKFSFLFRANGSYQPPVYTYLAIIPTIFFGESIFTIRFISALSGVLLVILTYFLVSRFTARDSKRGEYLGLTVAGIVAISPWAVHFSRLSVEANLGVLVFGVGVYMLLASLKKMSLFPFAALILGLSTHAYYSERVVSVLLLGIFLIVNYKLFIKYWKITLMGIAVFAVSLLPHIFLLTTGALTKRLSQVSYLDSISGMGPAGVVLYDFRQFINHYLSYYSPRNVFFDLGSSLGRVAPDLGAMYTWMLPFFITGLGYLVYKRKETLSKILLIIFAIAPIPAGLTGDAFYPLRTLDFLWIISVITGVGVFEFLQILRKKWLRAAAIIGLTAYSLVMLMISYFVVFKYETSTTTGKPYADLVPVLAKYPDKKIIVDTSPRAWGAGIIATYLGKEDPLLVQANMIPQMNSPYYSGDTKAGEIFRVKNAMFEPINWRDICGTDVIVVGDEFSFNPTQMEAHRLKLEFTVPDYLGQPVLFGYSTGILCN